MMSYLWILVLGSLMVTGVKMQEDGVAGAETEPATDDVAADDDATDDVTADNDATDDVTADNDATDDVTADNDATDDVTADDVAADDDTAGDDATDDVAADDVATDDDAPVEEKESTGSDDENTEDLPQDSDDTSLNAADAEEPKENADEALTPAAEEEPVEEEAPAETESPPPVDPEVTEAEINPEQGPGEAKEEPADQKPPEEEPAGGKPEDPIESEADEPQEDVEKKITGVRLSKPLDPTDLDTQQGEDPVRSAESASGPNVSGGGSGTVVGVVCGVAVAALGAIAGYFTHQKKKLCFKAQRADPESAKEENGTQNDPQVLSSLLTE